MVKLPKEELPKEIPINNECYELTKHFVSTFNQAFIRYKDKIANVCVCGGGGGEYLLVGVAFIALILHCRI